MGLVLTIASTVSAASGWILGELNPKADEIADKLTALEERPPPTEIGIRLSPSLAHIQDASGLFQGILQGLTGPEGSWGISLTQMQDKGIFVLAALSRRDRLQRTFQTLLEQASRDASEFIAVTNACFWSDRHLGYVASARLRGGDYSNAYTQLNLDTLAGGVSIRRILLLPPLTAPDDDLYELHVRRQALQDAVHALKVLDSLRTAAKRQSGGAVLELEIRELKSWQEYGASMIHVRDLDYGDSLNFAVWKVAGLWRGLSVSYAVDWWEGISAVAYFDESHSGRILRDRAKIDSKTQSSHSTVEHLERMVNRKGGRFTKSCASRWTSDRTRYLDGAPVKLKSLLTDPSPPTT